MSTVTQSILAGLLLFAATQPPLAEASDPTINVDIGGTGGSCRGVSREIMRNWFDVGQFMGKNRESRKRPRSKDLVCVSPYYANNAISKTIPGVADKLTCYEVDRQPFCCTANHRECAMLP